MLLLTPSVSGLFKAAIPTGELASNPAEDHELSMLALHLLQNCMVYGLY